MVRTPLVIKHAYVYVCVRVYMFVPVCVVWPRRYAAVTAYADIYVLTGHQARQPSCSACEYQPDNPLSSLMISGV